MPLAAPTSDSNLLSLGGRSWHFPFDLSFPTVYSQDSLDLRDDFYVNDERQKRSRLLKLAGAGSPRRKTARPRVTWAVTWHVMGPSQSPRDNTGQNIFSEVLTLSVEGGRARSGCWKGGAGGVFMTELSQLPHFSLSSARLMSPRRAERCHFLLSGSGIFPFWILPLSESELCGRRNASTWPQLRILLEM